MMYTSLDPTDPMVIIARACILACVILSAPLLHFPCRKAQVKLFWADDVEFSWFRHLGLMVFNLVLVYVLVIFIPNIQIVFAYAGAITATSLMVILPSLFYFIDGPGVEGDRYSFSAKRTVKHWICFCVVIIGVFLMVGNTILIALE